MLSAEGDDRQLELELLENLIEDLRVLENSWKKKKLAPKKVAGHFAEVVGSILDIARSGAPDSFEEACADLKTFAVSVGNGKTHIDQNSWQLTSELAELVRQSLRHDGAGDGLLEDWKSRWRDREEPDQVPGRGADFAESPLNARENKEAFAREDDEMGRTLQTDAEQLLRKAQEALSSGNGDDAKELALQAAQLIAEIEVEEARKKEKSLKADLEAAALEEAEAEETLGHLKEEMTEREQELASMNNRLSEAQNAFEQRQDTCHQLKAQIDQVESELASLKEKHQALRGQFEEALPARDAAERECVRLKEELEKLAPETEIIDDSVKAAESQLARARSKKQAIEAELEELAAKTAA